MKCIGDRKTIDCEADGKASKTRVFEMDKVYNLYITTKMVHKNVGIRQRGRITG